MKGRWLHVDHRCLFVSLIFSFSKRQVPISTIIFLVQNGITLGLFNISFSVHFASQVCPTWFGANPDIPVTIIKSRGADVTVNSAVCNVPQLALASFPRSLLLFLSATFAVAFYRRYVNDNLQSQDVKFGIQIGSDLFQMGQTWDFLRSVSVHFGSASQNVQKLILKSPRLSHNVLKLILKSLWLSQYELKFDLNKSQVLSHFGGNLDIPCGQ